MLPANPIDAAGLLPVVQRQAALHLMGDTSLPAETAAGLARSVAFCARLGANVAGGAEAQFAAGQKKAARLAARCKGLVHVARITMPQHRNIAYGDTLAEIEAGLATYSPRFFAHEIPAMIDYPLSLPVDEGLEGPEYLHLYLQRLVAENQLCACFAPERHAALLRVAGPMQAQLVRNISAPLLVNAAALLLLGQNPTKLDAADADRALFATRLTPESWQSAASDLPRVLGIAEGFSAAYLTRATVALQPEHPNELQSLVEDFTPPPSLSESTSLPGEALRALLGEMRACRYPKDRLAMLKRHFHTTADWAEALETALPPAEHPAALKLLNDEALAALYACAQQERKPVLTASIRNFLAKMEAIRAKNVHFLCANILFFE